MGVGGGRHPLPVGGTLGLACREQRRWVLRRHSISDILGSLVVWCWWPELEPTGVTRVLFFYLVSSSSGNSGNRTQSPQKNRAAGRQLKFPTPVSLITGSERSPKRPLWAPRRNLLGNWTTVGKLAGNHWQRLCHLTRRAVGSPHFPVRGRYGGGCLPYTSSPVPGPHPRGETKRSRKVGVHSNDFCPKSSNKFESFMCEQTVFSSEFWSLTEISRCREKATNSRKRSNSPVPCTQPSQAVEVLPGYPTGYPRCATLFLGHPSTSQAVLHR